MEKELPDLHTKNSMPTQYNMEKELPDLHTQNNMQTQNTGKKLPGMWRISLL